MATEKRPKGRGCAAGEDGPRGKRKIVGALKRLLAKKGFQEITWREIADEAGVSEALIYQHFKSRRGLLYYVLAQYLKKYRKAIWSQLERSEDALDRLRVLMAILLSVYNDNRVFARILLLEVRNFRDYFASDAYQMVRELGAQFNKVIAQGMASGEIRSDISVGVIRQVLLGAVEHTILPYVIFQKETDISEKSKELMTLLLDAVKNPDYQAPGHGQ